MAVGEQAPLVKTLKSDADPVGAGNDFTTNIGRAPFDGAVTAVTYTPDAAITGANTNTRTISVVNKGQSGSGNTVVATLALTSGVNPAASVEQALTLSGTAANLNVSKGDILAFTSTHVGTGIADPGGLVQVDVSRS